MQTKRRGILTAVFLLLGVFLLAFVGARNDAKKYHNILTVFLEYDAEITQLAGNGTKNDPYIVDSVEALCRFRDNVNAGYLYEYEYVEQTVDLDLAGIENWTPIGLYEAEYIFYGCYNGGGHTISNLVIYAPDENVGLFGQLGGTVVNLGIESGMITGSCVGSIASHGRGSDAAIINCYNRATLVGYRAGGIADNLTSGLIYNCYNEGEIIAVECGGVVGYGGKVIDSYSTVYPAAGAGFSGHLQNSLDPGSRDGLTATAHGAAEISQSLNKNLNSISINLLSGIRLQKWNVSGNGLSFGETAANLYPLRFCLVSLAVLAFLFTVQFFCLTVKERPLSLPRTAKDVREALALRWGDFCRNVSAIGGLRFFVLMAMLSAFVLSLTAVLCGDSASLYLLTYNGCTSMFYDFYVPLRAIREGDVSLANFYVADGGNYPPVARFFFWLSARFLTESPHYGVSYYRIAMPSFLCVIFILLFLFAMYRLLETKMALKKYRSFACVGLLLTTPMFFLIERANILLLCILFCTVFLRFYDADSPLLREIALFALALAAAIKIYPAILGLLLLREKRYRQAVRCAVYGAAVFFLPFLFLGGMPAFLIFCRNLVGFVETNSVAPRDHLVNYTNMMTNLLYLAGAPVAGANVIAKITQFFAMAVILTGAFVYREKWKILLCAVMILVLLPGTSVYYMLAFYLFPLYFLLQKEEHTGNDWFYAACLLLCLLPLQFLTGLFGWTAETGWQFAATAQLLLLLGLFAEEMFLFAGRIAHGCKARKAVKKPPA